jgi:hypothetical protein
MSGNFMHILDLLDKLITNIYPAKQLAAAIEALLNNCSYTLKVIFHDEKPIINYNNNNNKNNNNNNNAAARESS